MTTAYIIAVCAVLSAGLYAAYLLLPTWDMWLGTTRMKLKGQRIAVITFDDGPDEPYTSQVLDILKTKGVRATFFVLGSKAEKGPMLVKRMANEGHEVQNHTMDHRKVIFRNLKDIAADLISTSNVIERITGTLPKFVRTPHGFKKPGLSSTLSRLGLSLAPWTKGIWDTESASVEILKKRFSRRFAKFEILLLHDGLDENSPSKTRSTTVEVLPYIVDEYRRMGYKFMTMGELPTA